MATYTLTIACPDGQRDAVRAAIETVFADTSPPIAEFENEADGDWSLVAYFETRPNDADCDRLRTEFPATPQNTPYPLAIDALPDTDWVAQTQRQLRPVPAGRFLIHGSHDRNTVLRDSFTIEIDAATAFGTAHHGTTQGCLHALDALALTQEKIPPDERRVDRILDIGTGSGVLAIAAARAFPHATIVATDIDQTAIAVASENARINAAPGIVFVVADGTRHPVIRDTAPYALITANILAGPLIALAPGIAELAAPRATVVLSGLLDAQADDIIAAYAGADMRKTSGHSLDGWTTLVLSKSN